MLTMNTEIFEQIKEIMVKSLKIDGAKISENATFKDDLSMDSLEQAELIMELEKKYNCTIDEETAEKITTIAEAVNYIESISK